MDSETLQFRIRHAVWMVLKGLDHQTQCKYLWYCPGRPSQTIQVLLWMVSEGLPYSLVTFCFLLTVAKYHQYYIIFCCDDHFMFNYSCPINWLVSQLFYELRYFMICSCYGKVTSLNGEAEPGIVLEAVSRPSAACENLQEESKTEQDGSFRIRGLQVRNSCRSERHVNTLMEISQ